MTISSAKWYRPFCVGFSVLNNCTAIYDPDISYILEIIFVYFHGSNILSLNNAILHGRLLNEHSVILLKTMFLSIMLFRFSKKITSTSPQWLANRFKAYFIDIILFSMPPLCYVNWPAYCTSIGYMICDGLPGQWKYLTQTDYGIIIYGFIWLYDCSLS